MDFRPSWTLSTASDWRWTIVAVLAGATYATCASDDNTSRIAQVVQRSGWQTLTTSMYRSIEYFRQVDGLFTHNASGKLLVFWRSMQIFAVCGFVSIAFVLGMRLQGSSDPKETLRRALNLKNSAAASIMASESVNGEPLVF
jgi:hypothetical protein